MSKHVCATSSCGREFPSLKEQIELEIELEALARFVCYARGHQAGARGCCPTCYALAARIAAFQKEA